MDRKTSNITRQLAWLCFFAISAVVAIAVHAGVVIGNYLTTTSALELLGQDARGVESDAMLGPYLGALFGDATRVEFFALAMSACIALAFLLVVHLVLEALHDFMDGIKWQLTPLETPITQRDGSEEELDLSMRKEQCIACVRAFFRHGVEAAILIGALKGVVRWDVSLYAFAFRSDAPGGVAGDAAAALVSIGASGYVSLTILACIALEESVRKFGEHWNTLLTCVMPASAPTPARTPSQSPYTYPAQVRNEKPAGGSDAQSSTSEATKNPFAPPPYPPELNNDLRGALLEGLPRKE